MDKYVVTNPAGGRIREKRSTAEGTRVLKTLSKHIVFDVDGTIQEGGFVWLWLPEYRGWMRGDMAERITHSAEPSPIDPAPLPGDMAAALELLTAAQANISKALELLRK